MKLLPYQLNSGKYTTLLSLKLIYSWFLFILLIIQPSFARPFVEHMGEHEFLKPHGQFIHTRLSWVPEIDELKREPLNETVKLNFCDIWVMIF